MNDLYDRIRPADEVLDDATAARVWTRITGEESKPAELAAPQRSGPSALSVTDGIDAVNQRRRLAVWAAVAAVLVGIAGTAAIVATRSDPVAPADTSVSPEPTPQPATGPTQSPEPSPDSTIATAEANETIEIELGSGTNFVVADDVPDGWSIESMRAERAGSMFGEAQWAQIGPDGSVTGVISVRPPFLLTAEEIARSAEEFDDTVRGVPADVWQDDPNSGMPEQRNGIYWIEQSLQMQVSATGTAADLVRPVAEALVLDARSRTVTLPDSFGLIAAADLDFADDSAVRTTLVMQPDWSDAQGIGISAWPNTFGYDLDQLVGGTTLDWRPIQFDDTDAVGARTPDGDLVALSWLDSDMLITISTSLTLSDEEIFRVGRVLRFVDAAEFRSIGQSIATQKNDEISGWDVFDQAVTADGIEISIRTQPGGVGANAVCIDAPVVDCTLVQSEGGIVDGKESYGAAGFDLGDRRIGIGWVSSDIDAATIEPSIHPSTSLDPADLSLDETTSSVIADIVTDAGRFVVVDLPDGERPPAIRFESSDQLGPQIDLTPALHGPFEY